MSALIAASHFDDFLFSSVTEERNGPVSVLSMFGRLGLDPWQEALDLTELSKSAATRRLASSIDALAAQTETTLESDAIAALIIARLPRKISAPAPKGKLAEGMRRVRSINPWLAILVAGIVLLLGQTLLSESSHPPAAAAPQTTGNTDPH